MNEELKKAIQTLDETIPEPNNRMVDTAHLEICTAWQKIKEALNKTQEEPTQIQSYYVELWLKNEIAAAEERERNAVDTLVAISAGAQKAPLQRVLAKVEKWKGQTGLYEV